MERKVAKGLYRQPARKNRTEIMRRRKREEKIRRGRERKDYKTPFRRLLLPAM